MTAVSPRHQVSTLSSARKRARKRTLAARDGSWCAYCGRLFADLRHATIDHVVPISLFGTWRMEHTVLACLPCNRRKANRLPLLIALLLSAQVTPVTLPSPDPYSPVLETACRVPETVTCVPEARGCVLEAVPAVLEPGYAVPETVCGVPEAVPALPEAAVRERVESANREHAASGVHGAVGRALTVGVWLLLARTAAAYESGHLPPESADRARDQSRSDLPVQRVRSTTVRTACAPVGPTGERTRPDPPACAFTNASDPTVTAHVPDSTTRLDTLTEAA